MYACMLKGKVHVLDKIGVKWQWFCAFLSCYMYSIITRYRLFRQLCQSYPQSVLVPKSVTDDMLAKIAGFRQYGRFPFLSYYHKDSKVRTRFLLLIIISLLAYLLLNIFTLKTLSHWRWGVAHTIPWYLLNILNAGDTWWYLSVNIRPCLLISALIQNGTFHTFIHNFALFPSHDF